MTLPVKDWTRDHFISNEESCMTILEDANILSTIPSLNAAGLDCFKHGQLVRFKGMIQDMHNPEYYLEKYQVKNTITGKCEILCGKYTDSSECLSKDQFVLIDSNENKSSERQSFVMISIPALNEWAKECNNLVDVESKETNAQNIISEKRLLCEMEVDNTEHTTKKEKVSTESDEDKVDLKNKLEEKNRTIFLSKEHIMNFPIPNENGKVSIVKIYEEENLKYKLNQILEIVGFLSLDPALSTFHNSEEIMDDIEIQTHHPPASLVPRLHAIKVTNVTKPVVSTHLTLISKIECIRGDLHMALSQILFGDFLATDFLICHLISSIYMRNDCLSLGSFPLNITNFPIQKGKIFPRNLYNVLSSIVPKSYYLDCTLENLNDFSFIPKKDYECNRLTSGILQLSDNTHLVIDETNLESGQVSANGKMNYNAICDIVKFQKISYDFKYYTVEYETDIPVLILSEVPSFITSAIRIPIKSDEETYELYPQVVEAAKIYLKDEERLNNIRQYLHVLKYADFTIDNDIAKIIQEDFVNMRSTNKNVNSDDFHRLMILARLMSLSHGSTSLTLQRWKNILQMDVERISRLPRRK